jgi:hypothetical protein
MVAGMEPFATWYYLFAWYGILLAGDGLYARLKWSEQGARAFFLLGRPAHLLTLLGWSAVIWLFFELVNFRLQNWYYVFLPSGRALRWAGTVTAFATVLPAIFLAEALLARAGIAEGKRSRPLQLDRRILRYFRVAGFAMFAMALVWPHYFFPLVWGAATLVVEPMVYRRSPERSLLGDFERGRPGRILRLLLGGAAIGLLWEIFNVGARAKWIYTVPGLEDVKLFEMPILGFFGFPPFALECFVLWQALVISGLAIPREGRAIPAPAWQRAMAAAAACVFSIAVLAGMEARTISSHSPRLEDLPGVPGKMLVNEGLGTFTLADENPRRLSERFGVDSAEATSWIETARLATLRGIGTHNTALLKRLGIESVDALARADAAVLTSQLESLTGKDVVAARVRVWVRGARADESAQVMTSIRPGGASTTSPMTAAAGVDSARNPVRRSSFRAASTAMSRPPEVCASQSRVRVVASIAGAQRTSAATSVSLRRVPPAMNPASASARASIRSGTADAETRAPAPLARNMDRKWPSRPNPVMSVAACAPTASIAREAPSLSVVMLATAARTASSEAAAFLMAVEMTPVPIGFVRTSTSPTRAVELRTILSGRTSPITAMPYFGSASSTE